MDLVTSRSPKPIVGPVPEGARGGWFCADDRDEPGAASASKRLAPTAGRQRTVDGVASGRARTVLVRQSLPRPRLTAGGTGMPIQTTK
jgi:hypothetical protein